MAGGDILVLGATGRVGSLVVQRLAARGLALRALVRSEQLAREKLGSGIAFAEGDLRDAKALEAAASGCSQIIFTAGISAVQGRGTSAEVEYGAVAALASLLKGRDLDRFILFSSAGVTQPEHPHNCTFNSVLKWKLRGENALRASGLPYVIVRGLGLRERPGGEQGVRLVQGDRIAFGEDIAREDVAALLADLACLPVKGGFAPGIDQRSLCCATIEIFNDATISGGLYACAQNALVPDRELAGEVLPR